MQADEIQHLRSIREEAIARVEAATSREEAIARYEAEVFPLSLQLVVAQRRRADILVLTVGEQPYSVALSLAFTPADRVIALHTHESERNLDGALQLLPEPLRPAPPVERRPVGRADSTRVYETILDAVARNSSRDVVVDFTSGTKAMTAGASTVAGYQGWRQVYIESQLLDKVAHARLHSREVPQTVDHPLVVLGDLERVQAERAFDNGDFGVAAQAFKTLDRARVPHYHYGARARLAVAYRDWTDLRFAEASEGLRAVVDDLRATPARFVDREPLVELADRLAAQAAGTAGLATATRSEAVRPMFDAEQSALVIRWLLAGARREAPRRGDLAALLLYRALEAALQRRLATHGIDAGDVQIPEERKEAFLRAYNRAVGARRHRIEQVPPQLALSTAHTALLALEDAVVVRLHEVIPRGKFQGLTTQRNNSVYAHGFQRVDGRSLEEFRDVVLAYARGAFEADGLPCDTASDPAMDFVRLGGPT